MVDTVTSLEVPSEEQELLETFKQDYHKLTQKEERNSKLKALYASDASFAFKHKIATITFPMPASAQWGARNLNEKYLLRLCQILPVTPAMVKALILNPSLTSSVVTAALRHPSNNTSEKTKLVETANRELVKEALLQLQPDFSTGTKKKAHYLTWIRYAFEFEEDIPDSWVAKTVGLNL